MKINIENPGIEESQYFDETIARIDRLIDEIEIPLYSRVDHATNYFIDYLIEETSPNIDLSNEKHKIKLYFLIRDIIYRWYVNKYGMDSIEEKKDSRISAVILYSNSFLKINIPMTKLRPSKQKNEVWLVFISGIERKENIFRYFEIKNIENVIDKEKLDKVIKNTRKIIRLLRKMKIEYMFCNIAKEKQKQISDIWQHLNIATNDILTNSQKGISIGIWELFFAVELAIKLLYFDKINKSYYKHDIKEIIERLPIENKEQIKQTKFYRKFPDSKLCIKYRYSEQIVKNVKTIWDYYVMTIEILELLGSLLERKIRNKGSFSLLLKDPRTL